MTDSSSDRHPRVLLQFDTDPLPSSFDAVVAVDAGVDHLLQYGGVSPDHVEPLVHGAMFTRGVEDLRHTAIFIGGSRVADGEALLQAVNATFFGPMRVSVMLDSNGANTTAVAAVLAASAHLDLSATAAVVLGGTGPVGQRVARLLAGRGARVKLTGRRIDRAEDAADAVRAALPAGLRSYVEASEPGDGVAAAQGSELVINAGAAGVQLATLDDLRARGVRVAIDLNAVPPLGLEGVDMMDRAVERNGVTVYGAIGVGGTKMVVHKAALAALFDSADRVLDAETIYALGERATRAD